MGMLDRIRSLFGRKERVVFYPTLSVGPSEAVGHSNYATISDRCRRSGAMRVMDRQISSTKLPSSKEVKGKALSHFTAAHGDEWLYPQYDHYEIETVFDVETYFSRATRAKTALFSKEGYKFVGRKEELVSYIKDRISQIERASGLSFTLALERIARNLIVHSNGYWIKIRNTDASGGLPRRVGNRTLKPVAGYCPAAPETMVAKLDNVGNIVRWKQVTRDDEREFPVDDVIHFYVNKKDGYPFGVPSVTGTIEDIHSLRHIEENVEVLIRKNLFPLMLFRVGTPEKPATVYPDGTSEIDIVQERVADLPLEGSLVIPERYDVKAVGSEGRALRVEGYLDHFKKRVFAGLDVSSVDMGEGQGASRSTADTMSRNLVDIVKFYQMMVQEFVAQKVIRELLLESPFSEDLINSEDGKVELRFKEIDIEAKNAKENHAADLFLKNAITYSEFRDELGRDPLTEEQEKDLWWNKFGKPAALIQAVDESYTGLSQGATNSIAAKNNPSNQHGERGSAKIKNDSAPFVRMNKAPVAYWHNLLKDEFDKRWQKGELKKGEVKDDVFLNYNLAMKDLLVEIRRAVRAGYGFDNGYSVVSKEAERRATRFVDRLRDDLLGRLENLDDGVSPGVAFDALRYRASLIDQMEIAFAYCMAVFKRGQRVGRDIEVVQQDNVCNVCREKLTVISHNDTLGEERLPPFHPGCNCFVKLVDANKG